MKHRNFLRLSGLAAAAAGALWLFVGPAALSTANPSALQDSPVEDARGALEQYVETRRLISEERSDWRMGREILEDRIELVQSEIDTLRTKIEESRAKIDEDDLEAAKRADAVAMAKSATDGLEERIGAIEARVQALLARVPEPIAKKVEPLSQRFPADSENIESSLAERYQVVIGVLNELNKYHAAVHEGPELRTLSSGQSAEVEALYFGLSQGYYVDATGKFAGWGRATENGWTWTDDSTIAGEVREAIKILKNEVAASFVRLPVHTD